MSTPPGGSTRLFVALPIAPEARRILDTALREARGTHEAVRWTRAEGWHITLAFLGKVPEARVHDVAPAIRPAVKAAARPRRLALGPAGRFGNRVLWVSVSDEPTGSVSSLGESLQTTIEASDLPVERRSVSPHVTLARSRRGLITSELVNDVTRRFDDPAAWPPTCVQVWSSELGRGPARYHVVASIDLDA